MLSMIHGQTDDKLVVKGTAGFRLENMDWSIAGNLQGSNPNIKSELKWTDLVIADFSVSGHYQFGNRFSVEAGGSFGKTISGNVSDIDYLEDNRTNPSYQLHIKNKKGSDYSVFTHAGYHFYPSESLSLVPNLGYRFSSHTYWLSDDGIEQGGITLNSSYRSSWKGPYAGFDLFYKPNEKLTLQTNLQYHQINYSADANWNLMTQFAHPKSFEHSAKGFQILGSLTPMLRINHKIKLLLDLGYLYGNTGDGNDLSFMADGSQGYTRLNEVSRSYWQARLGIVFRLLSD